MNRTIEVCPDTYDHTFGWIHGHGQTWVACDILVVYTKLVVCFLKVGYKHEPSSVMDVKSLHLIRVFVET